MTISILFLSFVNPLESFLSSLPVTSDLGHGGRQDGAELRRGVPGSDPQLLSRAVDQEVRLLRREHLHRQPQGALAVRRQVLVLGEGSLQLRLWREQPYRGES